MWCGTTQRNTTRHNTLRYNTTRYDTIWYGTLCKVSFVWLCSVYVIQERCMMWRIYMFWFSSSSQADLFVTDFRQHTTKSIQHDSAHACSNVHLCTHVIKESKPLIWCTTAVVCPISDVELRAPVYAGVCDIKADHWSSALATVGKANILIRSR